MPKIDFAVRQKVRQETVRVNELSLLEREFLRGHDVPCRFCGCKSSEHVDVVEDKETATRQKGFRLSLWICFQVTCYAPINVREWEQKERAFQKEVDTEKRQDLEYMISKNSRYD